MANACQHIQRELLLFLDGDLPDRDAARIREHLDACHICQAELDAVAPLWQAEASRPEPPPDAWLRLQVRMASDRSFWARWHQGCRGAVVPAFRIAGVVAAIWLGVFIGSRPGIHSAPPDAAGAVARAFYLDAFDISPPVSISRIRVE